MLSNAYLLAKFRFDTAENEPAKILQNLPILLIGCPAGGAERAAGAEYGPLAQSGTVGRCDERDASPKPRIKRTFKLQEDLCARVRFYPSLWVALVAEKKDPRVTDPPKAK